MLYNDVVVGGALHDAWVYQYTYKIITVNVQRIIKRIFSIATVNMYKSVINVIFLHNACNHPKANSKIMLMKILTLVLHMYMSTSYNSCIYCYIAIAMAFS